MRVCLLCPKQIISKHKLCYSCYRQYHDQMHEPWFIALVELQGVQDRIDRKERYTIDSRTNTDLYGEVIETATRVVKKSIGRPNTDYRIVNRVLELYDISIENEKFSNGRRLSLRSLSRLLDGKIKYVTVRKILLQYRREEFMKRKDKQL